MFVGLLKFGWQSRNYRAVLKSRLILFLLPDGSEARWMINRQALQLRATAKGKEKPLNFQYISYIPCLYRLSQLSERERTPPDHIPEYHTFPASPSTQTRRCPCWIPVVSCTVGCCWCCQHEPGGALQLAHSGPWKTLSVSDLILLSGVFVIVALKI